MWLSSLRRLVNGKSCSRKDRRRLAARNRKPVRLMLESLEERLTPSGGNPTVTQTAGGYTALTAAVAADTASNTNYVIQITGSFQFNSGGQVSISKLGAGSTLTLEGQNGSNYTLTGNGNRLFDVAKGQTVIFEDLTLTGGSVTAASGAAQGGAVYNSGNLSMKSVVVGGNQAIGGSGQNGEGGGIYSNGGLLTLVNDVLGRKVDQSYTVNYSSSTSSVKQTTLGDPNTARGGAGGSGQGGGLYVAGGTVKISSAVLGGNHAYGGAQGNAQGGALYASGGSVTLVNDLIGSKTAVTPLYNSSGTTIGTISTQQGSVNNAGGGIGGNGQGGGIYANSTTLSLTGTQVDGNDATGGFGANGSSKQFAGGAGGNAQGGGIYANATTVTISSGSVNQNIIDAGNGGNGAAGTTLHPSGGAGGAAGTAEGGGLYVANGSITVASGVAIYDNSLIGGHKGGDGGNGKIGGAGGAGSNGEGGGLYAFDSSVTLDNGTNILSVSSATTPGINANVVYGCNGGTGGIGTAGAGGNGGNGGMAQGGGVFVSGSNLAVTLGNASQNATLDNNYVEAGQGGVGGLGHGGVSGVGGAGGLGTGGGLAVISDKLTLNNATLSLNEAIGGYGGSGARQGTQGSGVISNFGNGGNAQGGGLFVSNSSSTAILNSDFVDNFTVGESGGGRRDAAKNGTAKYGLGGTALGGGMYANSSTVNVLNSTITLNVMEGGTKVGTSTSGAHVTGGGTAQGGGVYAANGTLSLINDTVAWNTLVTYTNLGAVQGQGGGIYNGPSNTLNLENTIVALDLVFTNSIYGETNAYGTYNDLAGAAASQNDDNLIGGVNGINDANLVPGASEQLFSPAWYTHSFGNSNLSGQVPGNYGGLTDTLPLNWNTSPAISQGDPSAAAAIASAEGLSAASSATDQRGLPRVIDGTIDIGATQTQVILEGSPSVTTVQTGGTITYTLTVTNNESTAANVTLTDVLDPNTTYTSSSGANWTITGTPSTSSPGGTFTATISLAANSSATLTITVSVNATAPGNATLSNTASISPTGNNAAGMRSVTMDTQTQGATNITSEVGIIRSPVLPDPFDGRNAYVQGDLLFNWSGSTFTGPIALVLVGLPSNVTLTNASGYYDGSPYINIVAPGESWQAGLWDFLITILEFSTTNPADIKYTPEILQGI